MRVFAIVFRFPCVVVFGIARPLDQVFKLSSLESEVQYFFYFVFGFSFNFNGFRRCDHLARGRGFVWAELRDVDNVMDSERRWKLELHGIRGYDFNNCERSKLSFGEFTSWAIDIKVLGA